MWNTILFDLDGTLTDSGEGITRCVQYALKKVKGIDANLLDLRRFVGPPLKEEFIKYAHLTEEEGDLCVSAYRERYDSIGIYENRIYAGIRTLLKELKEEGMHLVLSSSKPTAYCMRILKYFDIYRYFDLVMGSQMDGRRTDKAEVIEEILDRLGMKDRRQEAVLVGDRNYDVVGAKKAGIGSIGITYGYGSREELTKAWPDCIADTPEEVRNVLIGQYRDGRQAEPSRKTLEQPSFYEVSPTLHMESPGFAIWSVIWPPLLALAINLVLGALLGTVMAAAGGASAEEVRQQTIRLTLPLTAVMDFIYFVVMLIIFRDDERRRTAYGESDRLLQKKPFGIVAAVMAICLTLGAEFLISLLSSLIPSSSAYADFVQSFGEWPFWAVFLMIAVIGPLGEEYLFRAVVFRRLRDYLSVWAAAAISGAIFGIFHGNLEQGIPAAALGFVLALIYEHYGTLKASFFAHLGVNSFALIQQSLPEGEATSFGMGLAVICISILAVCAAVWIFYRDRKVNRI